MNQPEKMTLKGTLQERQREKRKPRDSQRSLSSMFALPGRWILLLALVLAPWAFGSVYFWAQQWICLALLVGLGFWWFETAMNGRRRQVFPYISLLVLGGLLIGLLQLLALPDSVAGSIVGRQLEIYPTYTGNPDSPVRISLDQEGTWHQIRLLVIALAGLLLGCRYFCEARDIVLLLAAVTINGCLLSFFGILQGLTYAGSIYWVYEIERGAPFGPFINRNNGAGFLLMCLACCVGLWPIVMSKRKSKGPVQIISKEIPFWRQYYFYGLYFLAELTATKIALLVATILIASGIVSSLSRGGVVALLIGGMATLLVYGMARKPKTGGFIFVPLVLMVVLLSGWVGFGEKLIERFGQVDLVDVSTDGRIQHWQDTFPVVADMGLFGSGLGSYRGVHRLYSTGPESVLFEYAENQFFQSLVEAGWPGLVLFLLAWALAFHYASLLLYRGQSATSIGVGSFGVFLLTSQAVASMLDFGLYVPANMFLMATLVGFLAYHAHALSGRLKKSTWLKHQVSNYWVHAMLLLLFAATTVVGLDLHRRARLDTQMAIRSAEFELDAPDLEETDQRIKSLGVLVRKCRSVKALNYLAELLIHRTRLQFVDSLRSEAEFKNAMLLKDETEQSEYLQGMWAVTSLQRIQEHAYYLRKDVSSFQADLFLNRDFLRSNLPFASSYLAYSRQLSPLQPVVQIRLGQINAALGGTDQAATDIERGIELAPNNTSYRLIAGMFYLQAGDVQSAAKHFRKYLELAPNGLSRLMSILQGKTGRRLELVGNREIFESFIPADPNMLFEFYNRWLGDDAEVGSLVLEKAVNQLDAVSPLRIEDRSLRAKVLLALGRQEQALADLIYVLQSNPMDASTQYLVAKVLFEIGRWEEALKQAKKLLDINSKNRTYNELFETIETAILKREVLDQANENRQPEPDHQD